MLRKSALPRHHAGSITAPHTEVGDMKRYISATLAAIAIAAITACGGGTPQASTTTSASSPSTPLAQTARPVPDMTGKRYVEARRALKDEGFTASLVGKDGTKWTNVVPDTTVMIVSTDPAAGTVTDASEIAVTVNLTEAEFVAATKVAAEANKAAAADKAAADKAAADAKKLATRYSFSCSDSTYSAAGRGSFHDFRLIWPTKHYEAGWGRTCSATVADSKPSTTEQGLIDLIASKGGDVTRPMETVGKVMGLCARLPDDYDAQVIAHNTLRRAEAEAALSICPDAPHAGVLKEVMTSAKVGDGTKVVGQTMEPGTYKTKPGSKDCYWSRNTGGGDILDNGFVGFAPDGVTVTVYPGEGFQSERCGTWTKIR
jgi:hypothetical protein